jgi:hypothetical protein
MHKYLPMEKKGGMHEIKPGRPQPQPLATQLQHHMVYQKLRPTGQNKCLFIFHLLPNEIPSLSLMASLCESTDQWDKTGI